MSTMKKMSVRCSVCRAESEHYILTSTNSFGAPDLDLRPPEMQRSTMPLWVQRCPRCGYVASSLSTSAGEARELVYSGEYKTCYGREFKSELAKKFYQHYLIMSANGKIKDTFYAALHAAWASDDALDRERAREMRLIALKKLEKLMEIRRNDETLLLIRCDIMRRAGLFDELIALYGETRLSDELPGAILAFQLKKARERCDRRFTVSDARNEGKLD